MVYLNHSINICWDLLCWTLWRPEKNANFHSRSHIKYGRHCTSFHETHNSSVASRGDQWHRISPTSINKYENYGKEFIYALTYTFTDPIFTGLKQLDNSLKKKLLHRIPQKCDKTVWPLTQSHWRTEGASPQKALKHCGLIRDIIPMSACRKRVYRQKCHPGHPVSGYPVNKVPISYT
jgi:hypothetical protein